jgi:hypothetical protein
MFTAPIRRTSLAGAAVLAAIVAIACTDRPQATEPEATAPAGKPGAPGVAVPLVAVDCTANVQARTVSCGVQGPAAGDGHGNLLLGTQNLYVTLTSSNITYNAGTGQFKFDVTVKNLIPQPLGTTDGSTLDPAGVRVFFNSGPTVTEGFGSAAVVPDGFATFLAPGQPYYQYNQVLAQGVTSAAHTWTLVLAPTVTTVTFRVYVAAPVEYPDGYVTLDGELPDYDFGYMHPTTPHALTAVVHDAVGNVLPGAVTFGTSNPACATVSPTGVVTGVQYATCTITATSGALLGSMIFDVSGTGRVWGGAVSSDWSLGANWTGGLVPAAADSAIVPTGVPNFPVLTAPAAISNVTVADGATLNLASFALTATGDVATGATAGSGILASGAGQLNLTGTGKLMHGRFPRALVTGTYSLDGNYHGVAPEAVDKGKVTSTSYNLMIEAQ